jgi:uncharacterized phage protein gp47/JayE
MPFNRPAFQDLINSAMADLNRLPGADATLRRSLLLVLAYQAAALASGEYDYIAWAIVNCLLPGSATEQYLDRWLNIFGLQREAPVPAAGNVIFSGTVGRPVPIGTQVQTSNSAVVLTTTAAETIGSGGTVSVPVIATVGGSAGNLLPGAPVTLLVGNPDLVGTAVVDGSGLSGGADAETDAAARVRLLQRTSSPPQGGAAYDYVSWAQRVTGVTRVWVYPLLYGLGTVGVTFAMDGRSNVIPLSADVTTVQNAIQSTQGAPPAPVTAVVTVFAPTGSTLAIGISNLVISNGFILSTVQANISAGLAALFATTTPGGTAWDSLAEAFKTGGFLKLEQISQAIANAAGVATFDLTSPTADQAAGFGVLLELGAVSYS